MNSENLAGTEPGAEIVLGHKLPTKVEKPMAGATARIIYRLIDYKIDPQSGHIDIVYVNYNQKPFNADLDPFIDTIRSPQFDPTYHGHLASTSPLDVNCKEKCYLVFQLVRSKNWQFGAMGDCFSTKQAKGTKYSNLQHVMDDGSKYGSGAPVPDGCRILYLTAECTDDPPFADGFNLRVDLVLPPVAGQPRRTKLIIDPDIRNPGGSGEPLIEPAIEEHELGSA